MKEVRNKMDMKKIAIQDVYGNIIFEHRRWPQYENKIKELIEKERNNLYYES